MSLESTTTRTVAHATRSALLCTALIVTIAVAPGAAHKRNFAWTYDWFTPAPTEREIETWHTWDDADSSWEHLIEYEFSVTDRWGTGIYAIFEDAAGSGLDFAGWKWENRYRFGDFKPNRWLHAAYLEWKKQEGQPHELEAKWIVGRYAQDREALALNLVAERELESGADVEWKLVGGWGRPVAERARLGAEAVAELSDDEYYVGPTFSYDPGTTQRIIGSALVGLTDGSSDLKVRVLTEWEWF